MTPPNPLVQEVVSGESFELRVLAAQGILPLSLSELVPLQVMLAGSEDPFLSDAARKSLAALVPRVASVYLASDAPQAVLRYFAIRTREPKLLEAILRRRDVERDLLVEIAPTLSQDLQEVLLLRQDAIVDQPEILDALEKNPMLSPYARRRVREYREHLLPRAQKTPHLAVASEEPDLDDLDLSDEEREAIERARAGPAGGEVDRATGLSEQQIRSLPLPARLKLGRGASRTLRSILIRDGNTNVALAVLSNSAFSEDEIEQISANRTVIDEVLIAICRHKEWVSRHGVCLALIRNPRTPAGIAIKLMPKLSVRDLRNLTRDRSIADVIRTHARKLYRIKTV